MLLLCHYLYEIIGAIVYPFLSYLILLSFLFSSWVKLIKVLGLVSQIKFRDLGLLISSEPSTNFIIHSMLCALEFLF